MSGTISIHGGHDEIAPGLSASSDGTAYYGARAEYRAAFVIWGTDTDGFEHRLGRVEIPVSESAKRVEKAKIAARWDELAA